MPDMTQTVKMYLSHIEFNSDINVFLTSIIMSDVENVVKKFTSILVRNTQVQQVEQLQQMEGIPQFQQVEAIEAEGPQSIEQEGHISVSQIQIGKLRHYYVVTEPILCVPILALL